LTSCWSSTNPLQMVFRSGVIEMAGNRFPNIGNFSSNPWKKHAGRIIRLPSFGKPEPAMICEHLRNLRIDIFSRPRCGRCSSRCDRRFRNGCRSRRHRTVAWLIQRAKGRWLKSQLQNFAASGFSCPVRRR